MSSGRLKVFPTQAEFFSQSGYRRSEQRRIVKQNDELLNCLSEPALGPPETVA